MSQLFFIFTSTQVKKWTGNVPFLHIIGLDRPQTTFNRYTIILLHPKKQDAEEDYTSFFTRIECIYYFVQPSPTLGTKTWTISERIHIIPFCRWVCKSFSNILTPSLYSLSLYFFIFLFDLSIKEYNNSIFNTVTIAIHRHIRRSPQSYNHTRSHTNTHSNELYKHKGKKSFWTSIHFLSASSTSKTCQT